MRLRSRLLRGAVAAAIAATVGCSSGGGQPVAASGSDTTALTGTTLAGDVAGGTDGTGIGGQGSTVASGTGSGTIPPTSSPPTTAATTTTTAKRATTGTGVTGRVTAGPTCPVERADHACPPNPVHGRVDSIDSAGRTAASAMTDAAGRYAVTVAPGVYTLRVVVDGLYPRCPDTSVTVTAGSMAVADIGCDTGIR